MPLNGAGEKSCEDASASELKRRSAELHKVGIEICSAGFIVGMVL